MIVFNYIQYMQYYKFGQKGRFIIVQKVFSKLMHAGGKLKEKYSSGDILRIIEHDSVQIENLIGQGIGQLMVNIIVVLGVIILLLSKQVFIAIIMIGISLIFSIVQFCLSNSLKREAGVLRKTLGDTSSYTNEMILNSEKIVTSGYAEDFINEHGNRNKDILSQNVSQMKKSLISRNIGIAYNIVGNLVTLGIGVIAIRDGTMTVGDLLAISMYIQRLYSPLLIISNSYLNIKKAVPYIEKVIDFLDQENCIEDGKIILDSNLGGRISFNNISFKYDEKYILNNFNLLIEKGKISAIIGKNGSGKSTIIKLLIKLYKINSGEIYIDDININDYSNNYLYKNISVMFQNNILISGSLRDVVNPGKKQITEEELRKIFLKVRLDIDKFENGLDTYIHENSINISEGELQKINIVRILIEDRSIIILDEPTSALDNESENEICELLHKLLKGKTVIIITHRERILDICDRVIHFDN